VPQKKKGKENKGREEGKEEGKERRKEGSVRISLDWVFSIKEFNQ
jgi:hypothetical protein